MSEETKDLKYTATHEWISINEGIATIGVTDFAQKQLTDIVFIELPKVGSKTEKDKSFATVESVKSVSDIFAPVSGEVTEINEKLSDSPDLINKSCYTEGWIAKIKIENEADLNSLMTKEQYKEITKE